MVEIEGDIGRQFPSKRLKQFVNLSEVITVFSTDCVATKVFKA